MLKKKIHCAFIVKNRSLVTQTGRPQQEGLSGAFRWRSDTRTLVVVNILNQPTTFTLRLQNKLSTTRVDMSDFYF